MDMNKQFSIIVPTDYGQIIVDRFDHNQTNTLFKTKQAIDHNEICLMAEILRRLKSIGPAVQASTFIDVGACFGTWAIALAPICKTVHVFEPQRILFNMICGSVALNSFEHVYCHNVAIGRHAQIPVPQFDYGKALNFGSIEFGEKQTEPLDQERGTATLEFVQCRALDDFKFESVDAIKIDVEGMEVDALHSASYTIFKSRPVVYVETLKSDPVKIREFFDTKEYSFWDTGMNYLCVPNENVEKLAGTTAQLRPVHDKVKA